MRGLQRASALHGLVRSTAQAPEPCLTYYLRRISPWSWLHKHACAAKQITVTVTGAFDHSSITAAAEVGQALESEAVAAAVREAEFERLQRESAEAAVHALHVKTDQLKLQLKKCQVQNALHDVMLVTSSEELCLSEKSINLQPIDACPSTSRHLRCM